MTVDINTVVSLHYKLTNQQTGEKIEETLVDRPMQFLYGVERVIPAFEESIHGKGAGDSVQISVEAKDAYGTRQDNMVVDIPNEVFFDESGKINTEHIFVGAVVPMTDPDGRPLRGTVVEMQPAAVRMDFNHPLADTDLHFEVKILSVRQATADEIAHGHSHGEHGHHH